MCDGKDCRRERILERKQELRRLLNSASFDARIHYVDHVDGSGILLFEQVCKLDLEGIVAKQKHARYVTDREQSTWFKIRNPHYSQWAGGEKFFERAPIGVAQRFTAFAIADEIGDAPHHRFDIERRHNSCAVTSSSDLSANGHADGGGGGGKRKP